MNFAALLQIPLVIQKRRAEVSQNQVEGRFVSGHLSAKRTLSRPLDLPVVFDALSAAAVTTRKYDRIAEDAAANRTRKILLKKVTFGRHVWQLTRLLLISLKTAALLRQRGNAMPNIAAPEEVLPSRKKSQSSFIKD